MNDTTLYTLLSGDSGITAITDRIYNGPLPEKTTLPAVTFEFVSDTPYNALDGDTGQARNRYTINAWTNSNAGALALEAAIKTAMVGYFRASRVALHEEKFKLWRYALDYTGFS